MTLLLLPFFTAILLLKIVSSVIRMAARLAPFFVSLAVALMLLAIVGSSVITTLTSTTNLSPTTSIAEKFATDTQAAVAEISPQLQRPVVKQLSVTFTTNWKLELTQQAQLSLLKSFPNPNQPTIEKLEKLRQQHPPHRDVLFNLSVLLEDENPVRAETYLNQAKQLDPNSPLFTN